MEVWDVYDERRIKTGETMIRDANFEKNAHHLVVHICIFNAKGEMLIQQRQSFKKGWPNLWDITVGGSAVTGETAQEAAHRELLEEIGYDYDFSNRRPNFTVNFSHGFNDIFLIEEDLDISKLKLQYEEVQAVRWATREEIRDMIADGSFIDYLPSLIDLFFEARGGLGCFQSEISQKVAY